MNSVLTAREEQLTRWIVGALSFTIVGVVTALVLRSPGPGAAQAAESTLPSINAVLNGTAAVLLVAGYMFIRRRNIAAHRVCMTTAVVVSSLFLVTYILHHYQVGSVRFAGTGWLRNVYLAILIPHIVLSTVMVPMALTTLAHAWRGRFQRHRRIARWTLPIWLYVSVSGVVVYWMLYHLGR